jgi:hypothetical protein
MLWKRILVRDQERALIARNGKFCAILNPGKHVVFAIPGVSLDIENFDVRDLVFRSRWSNHLVEQRPDVVAKHFTLVATSDVQLAMIYADGKLVNVLLPGQSVLFWRGLAQLTIETVHIAGDPDALSDDDEPGGLFDNLRENIPAGVK